ncbi:hypothetical protein PVAP13_4NG125265 [Panicum virgatum]|uniref:GRF-type domain-containing protein n=1 Tax=Panicum virgatum TaxID=38727 RepID=A0A8T0T644_PANVG|nr:hypothetical protein PVAP13_4NG125265 [Panicum virgatum]
MARQGGHVGGPSQRCAGTGATILSRHAGWRDKANVLGRRPLPPTLSVLPSLHPDHSASRVAADRRHPPDPPKIGFFEGKSTGNRSPPFPEVHMAMSDARYKLLGGGQYPSECDEDAPVPHALPVPFCRCEPGNQLAEVKQSRHPKTAGRAFYICKWNDSLNHCHCFFFQWIDGPDKFDPRIRLFPYYRSESWAYKDFRRWVPPPPNPPLMTEEEKQEAAIYRVNNPPKCHCGVRAKLQRPNIGVPPKFTPFF